MKEKNNIITIEIFIILFALIALIFSLGTYLSKKDVFKEKNTAKEVEVEKEEEVVDEDAEYKEILSYVNMINASNKKNITDIYNNEINISDISKSKKLYSILYKEYIDEKYEEDSYVNEEGNTINRKFLNLDKIKEIYKNIYNEDIDDYTLEEDMCPVFQLLEDKFYIYDNCDGNKNDKMISYIYKKVIGKNSADIYLSLGVMAYKDKSYDIYRYDEYMSGENYIVLNTESELFFSLDENNYKDFSLFLVHFVKNGEKYYFSSIRRTLS